MRLNSNLIGRNWPFLRLGISVRGDFGGFDLVGDGRRERGFDVVSTIGADVFGQRNSANEDVEGEVCRRRHRGR